MAQYRPKRILFRIFLPMTVLFAVSSILSLLFSAYCITHYLDRSLKQQLEQVAAVISRSSYVLNPAILSQLKDVINSEIVLSDSGGRVLRSTFSGPVRERLREVFRARPDMERPFITSIEWEGVKYRTVIHPLLLSDHGQAFLSLWLPASKADRLKERIIISVGGAALMGIFAMAAAAYLIARTITRPVEELVQVTRKVAAWDLGQRAIVRSRDEIGLLADSFNQMIHRLREYEERLVESEKMAAAGQIAAGLAHEVRNPLTSIKMFVQVLHGRMEKHSENRDMLTALVQEINRLDRIIQRIVDRARPGELHRQQADIHEHLKNVLQLAAETLISGNISVALRLEARPAMVYADIEKIKQVFWNLVINSMEAMPGGGNLTISTRSGPDGITILFEDTGPGLGVEDPEQFFASFYTTKPEGMGLGLSMSRRIIEKHGGALSLKNRKQGGAVACIILPTDNREV